MVMVPPKVFEQTNDLPKWRSKSKKNSLKTANHKLIWIEVLCFIKRYYRIEDDLDLEDSNHCCIIFWQVQLISFQEELIPSVISIYTLIWIGIDIIHSVSTIVIRNHNNELQPLFETYLMFRIRVVITELKKKLMTHW